MKATTYQRWLAEPDELQAVERPHRDLGLAVLRQAVADYRILQRAGLVEGQRVVTTKWPRQKGRGSSPRAFCGITLSGAGALITFLKEGGWDVLAEAFDFQVSGHRVCRELGVCP